jgi:3-hydroxyacyl-[acyl-carrier protein] dehydratase / trans-2-decenoyl-[acyl-carrier protein] isomerase
MTKQTYYSEDDVMRGVRGELFGKDNARLPAPNMLMFDRIVHVEENGDRGAGEVVAELDIRPDLWFFQCHFENDPVMPGCLGLDALWQLMGFYLAWKGFKGHGRALGVKEVKFRGQVLPSAKLVTYRIAIERVMSSKLIMAIADGTLSADGRDIYFAKGLRVGFFESTEGF